MMTSEYMYPMQDHLLELLFDNSKKLNREPELQLRNRQLPPSFFAEPGTEMAQQNQNRQRQAAQQNHMSTPMRVPHVHHSRSGTGAATGGGMRGVIVNHSKSKSSPSIHQTLLSTHSRAASVQQLTNGTNPQQRPSAGGSTLQHHSPNAVYLNNNNNIDSPGAPLSPEEISHLEALKRDKNFVEAVQSLAEQMELPDGWAIQFTVNKECYFVDHHNQSTTWNDPRLQMAENQLLQGELKQLKIKTQISQIMRRKQQLHNQFLSLDKQELYLRKALEDDMASLSLSSSHSTLLSSTSATASSATINNNNNIHSSHGGLLGISSTGGKGVPLVQHRHSNSCSSLIEHHNTMGSVPPNQLQPPPPNHNNNNTSHINTANELMHQLVLNNQAANSGGKLGSTELISIGGGGGQSHQQHNQSLKTMHYRQSSADSGIWTGAQRRMSTMSRGGSYETSASSCVSSPENLLNTPQSLPGAHSCLTSPSQESLIQQQAGGGAISNNMNYSGSTSFSQQNSTPEILDDSYGFGRQGGMQTSVIQPQQAGNQSSVIVSTMNYIAQQQQQQQQQQSNNTVIDAQGNLLGSGNNSGGNGVGSNQNLSNQGASGSTGTGPIGGCLLESLVTTGDSAVSGVVNNISSFANNQNNNESSVIQPNNNQVSVQSASAAAMDTDEDELLNKLLDDYSIFNTSSNSTSPTVQLAESTGGGLVGGSNGRIVATSTNNGSINNSGVLSNSGGTTTTIPMSCMAQNGASSSTMQGMGAMDTFVTEGGLPVFH